MASTEQSSQMIRKAIKDLEGKMNDPSFLEKLSNNGHIIASDFLELVRIDLNYLGMQVGKDSPLYIELCEAVALIGSGCLRWATAKSRVLISTSDFRKNRIMYDSEKTKVEKCFELIKVFSKMVRQDSSAAPLVLEVANIVSGLQGQFQKKSGCYIATVVYKDPFSVEVLAFKTFRDNVLSKILFGRIILALYYYLSPCISRFLIKRERINYIIKWLILDPLYRKIL